MTYFFDAKMHHVAPDDPIMHLTGNYVNNIIIILMQGF